MSSNLSISSSIAASSSFSSVPTSSGLQSNVASEMVAASANAAPVTPVAGVGAPDTNEAIAVEPIQTMKELKKAESRGDKVTPGDEYVIKTIEKANKALEGRYTTFEFSVHEKTKQISIKVFDKDTGELIREIPPEKTLDMVARMWEMAGLLIDEKR